MWEDKVSDIEVMLPSEAWNILCASVRLHGSETASALEQYKYALDEEEEKGAAIASALKAAQTLSGADMDAWQKDMLK